MDITEEILDILAQFGGGRCDSAQTAVRFLLPALFWGMLAWIALGGWKARREKRDLYISVAAFVGLSRELVLFIAEYGGRKGIISFEKAHRVFPPLEHALTMLSGLLIGYAFMKYFLPWRKFSRTFLKTGSAIIAVIYLITVPAWISFLDAHPDAAFGAFWGDMVFRVTASILIGIVLGSLFIGNRKGLPVPKVLYVAFSFLFLDEFLMIINLATGEIHRTTYCPVRHNLHIWAVPLLGAVYWKELFNELANEKERLFVTLRSISEGVIATDAQGLVVLMNKAAMKLTGWEQSEAVGRRLSDVFHIVNEKTGERLDNPPEKVLLTGGIVGPAQNTALISQDGTERSIDDSGAPIRDREGKIIGMVLVFRDITEKRKRDEEFLRSQKLESIGVLAGGIAHDFNNLLTAILWNLSSARTYESPQDTGYKRLAAAEKAVIRATDLARQLLTFAKGGAPVKKTAPVAEMIKESAVFALRGSKSQCEFSIPYDLWAGNIDAGQISQVLHNLVLNADEAMPQGGTIHITCENITLSESGPVPLKGGRYVKITVRDEGMGIPTEYLERIFDPYFTTKQEGSGLGLAVSYSIIRKHDGHISVESTPGKGTTFYIYLPASLEKLHVTAEKGHRTPVACEGRILLMDDEDDILEIVSETLTQSGFTVECAKDGREAVDKYKKAMESGTPFKAVILDLTIRGGMGGRDAVKNLLAIDPSVKAIASSGYSSDPITSDLRKYGFSGVLIKPYRIEDVERVLLQVIGSGGGFYL